MFIAALFTIAKTWKQPKCPLTEEWIQKMWYIYTVKYYSAIKKNEIPAFLATWMDLEVIMLSEVRQWDTNIKCYHLHVECKKRTQWTSLQNRYWLTDFEKLMVSKRDRLQGMGDELRVWDGNAVKFGCDYHCTIIIKFIELKKISPRL